MIQELLPIIQQVDFDFPFDFENDPRKVWMLDEIIDYLHRLIKTETLGMEKILAREVPVRALLRIIGPLEISLKF